MKKILVGCSLMLSLGAFADIDSHSAINIEPKAERVEAARSCFGELEKMGCGHPRDDQEQFKTCLREVYPTVTPGCQKMMKRLYGK